MRLRAGRLGFNGGWAWDFRLCGSRHAVLLALGWWYVRVGWGPELVVEGPENTDWLQRRRRETSHNRETTNFEGDRSDESPP